MRIVRETLYMLWVAIQITAVSLAIMVGFFLFCAVVFLLPLWVGLG